VEGPSSGKSAIPRRISVTSAANHRGDRDRPELGPGDFKTLGINKPPRLIFVRAEVVKTRTACSLGTYVQILWLLSFISHGIRNIRIGGAFTTQNHLWSPSRGDDDRGIAPNIRRAISWIPNRSVFAYRRIAPTRNPLRC